jgi:hypothetical protein
MLIRVKIIGPKTGPLEKKIQQAIARGLNEGGDKVRTQVQRALKTQTGVTKYASITSRINTLRAYPAAQAGVNGKNLGAGFSSRGPLSYHIIAAGKGIPIKEFPVRVTKRGVDAKTWGVDHVFKRSFAMKGRPIATALRARLTGERFPIRVLYGPSLPKELTKGSSAQAFMTSAQLYVVPAVLKHLTKTLGA